MIFSLLSLIVVAACQALAKVRELPPHIPDPLAFVASVVWPQGIMAWEIAQDSSSPMLCVVKDLPSVLPAKKSNVIDTEEDSLVYLDSE
ncbi:hypothetical protein BDP27DRAFT_1424828 [Rhodocollybia butyracea]|uniref:Secreted protein n=1 Tax=Rhodocollybia butyracea TaxID=206335 RepID=A0A9P5PLG6_9AGAR|nr:hypothetical protein BDP27DRAFT_1424828 [Rhodocollybia butyracea]